MDIENIYLPAYCFEMEEGGMKGCFLVSEKFTLNKSTVKINKLKKPVHFYMLISIKNFKVLKQL